MQTFIFGLLLAGVSGVTIVAFRHSIGFARLFPYLIAVVTAVFVGFNIWHVAIEVSWSGLLGFIDGDAFAEAIAAKDALRYSYTWLAFWYVGVIAYLWIMLRLPPFLQIADKERKPINENESD
jgi:branched-subunit amino acid ABC-type transport system permease component